MRTKIGVKLAEPLFQTKKYRTIRKVNEGVSGNVFLVEADGKQFALKSIKTSDPASISRFRRESATLARLSHPNLVKIFDVGEEDGRPFLVMEYVEGKSLQAKIKAEGRLSEDECVQIIISIAEALTEVHKNNLVHRDIKPANILISDQGIKLIDLGLVGDVDQIKNETPLVGTPLYCSPEQTKILKRDVTFCSDIYSLGIVFYEMLTGTPPFVGTLSEILQQHSSTPVPDLKNVRPTIRPSVIAIIKKLLAKDPDDRYQSVLSVIHDLRRLPEIDELMSRGLGTDLGQQHGHTLSAKIKYIKREEEVEKLRFSWNEAKNGRAGLFIVKGASGSGKTRLCSEFLSEVTEESKKILVLRGKSQFLGRDLPFGVLREAIDGLLDHIASSPVHIQDLEYLKLSTAAKGHEDNLLKFCGGLQRAFKTRVVEKVQTDVEGEKEKFFNSITEFFVRLSHQWKGLVFFIDDLQWLDGSSLQLIEMILTQPGAHPLFILGTSRNDIESLGSLKIVEEALKNSIRGQLNLEGFKKEQMVSLLSDYLGTRDLNPEIIEILFSRSAGNPLVATEYLRAVVEQGYLVFKDNQWRMEGRSFEKLIFSDDVYSLIMKRIDRSSEGLRTLLEYASLFGNTFNPSEIAVASKIEEEQLRGILGEAEKAGLLDVVNEQASRFSHDKVPESLRQALRPEKIRDMSDALAQFYRSKIEKTHDEIFTLARLAAAGNYGKDADFVISANADAGFLSLTNHAHAQAFAFLKCAFNLSKGRNIPRVDLLKIVSKLAVCATVISDWVMADECVQKALDLSSTQDEMVASLSIKVWAKKARGDITMAWETFREACLVLGRPYPAYLHWKILNFIFFFTLAIFFELTNISLGFLFSRKGKREKLLGQLSDLYFEAQYCSEYMQLFDFFLISVKILVLGQISGRKRELALGYACTGYAFANFGIKTIAVPFLEKAVDLSEELGDPTIKAVCLSRKIDGLLYCGATYDESTEFKKHFEFMKRYMNPVEVGRFRSNRTTVLGFKGRNKEAVEFLRTFLDVNDPESSQLAVLSMLHGLHQYWYNFSLLGKPKESQTAKRMALAKSSNYRFVPVAHRFLAQYELQVRRYSEEADDLVDDLREYYAGNSIAESMNRKFTITQLAFLDLYELERVKSTEAAFSLRRRFKAQLQRAFFTLTSPLYRVNYHLLQAVYCRVTDNLQKAEKWLASCEEIAASTGHLRILFEIQRERARIHKKRDNPIQVRTCLAAAFQLAADNHWAPSQDALIAEFGEDTEKLIAVGNFRGGFESQTGQTIMAATSHSSAGATSVGASSGVSRSASSSSFGDDRTTIGGDSQEDFRFVDALLSVSDAFVSSLDSVEQSKAVLVQIIKLFAAERGFVFMKDSKLDNYSVLNAKDAQGLDLKNVTGFSSTVVKKVFEDAKTVIVASAGEAEALGSDSAVLYNLRSVMATPLMIKDKIVGAVYLDSSLTKGLFSKKDTYLFSTLANHIAVAFELSRMARVELEKASLKKELEIQAAVAASSKKVEILVENMKQALFSVSSDGTIIEPISRYSEQVLGNNIIGQPLFDVLYKDLQNKSEVRGVVQSAMNTVFGEDDLQWDLMEENFPRRVNFIKSATANAPESEHILKAQLSPIWDSDKKLERILFVVEDVTNLEALEGQAAQHRLRAVMLEDILDNQSVELQDFFDSSTQTLEVYRQTNFMPNDINFQALLRDLHTMKGNAGLFRMRHLTVQIHRSESTLQALQSNFEAVAAQLPSEINFILEVINQYKELLGRLLSNGRSLIFGSVAELATTQISKIATKLSVRLTPDESHELQTAINRFSYKSIKESVAKFKRMAADLSRELGKKVELDVEGDALLDLEKLHLIQDCLVHIIRNSIDHGIEGPDARTQVGKPEIGKIRIQFEDGLDCIKIKVSDDGRGIDAEKIAAKAVEKGLIKESQSEALSKEDKINLIFLPNFSTREVATEISGRGIGMDAVKQTVEKMGGDMNVTSIVGQGVQIMIKIAS